MPEYFIYPSQYVAASIKANYQQWLNKLGRNSQAHNDNSMREFKCEATFKDRWDQFK